MVHVNIGNSVSGIRQAPGIWQAPSLEITSRILPCDTMEGFKISGIQEDDTLMLDMEEPELSVVPPDLSARAQPQQQQQQWRGQGWWQCPWQGQGQWQWPEQQQWRGRGWC